MEVIGPVEMVYVSAEIEFADAEAQNRRRLLNEIYCSLPHADPHALRSAVRAPEIPLEVVVRCLRDALANGDEEGQGLFLETIIVRIQTLSECWAQHLIKSIAAREDECEMMVEDLCEDLYEKVIRALYNPQCGFWEENFWHCLRYERMHAFTAFLRREGRWSDQRVKRGIRVPRSLVARMNFPQIDALELIEVEDERALEMFLAIEDLSDVLEAVLRLPDAYRRVILSIYWQGKTEKEVARTLGITDRAVRYRMSKALQQLQAMLSVQGEGVVYG